MKKILSCLLILSFIFFSGLNTIQVSAEESTTNQQDEKESTPLDEELIPEQQNEIETTDTNAETEIEPDQQEEPDDEENSSPDDSISKKTENDDGIFGEQTIEDEVQQLEESQTPSARVAADSEKPVIDISSIWIDNTSVYYGDTVTIRVKVTDNDEIDRVHVELINKSSSKILSNNYMDYNDDLGLYEWVINVDNSISSGVWFIFSILAYDKTGNMDSCSLNDNNYSFSLISNTDSEKPVINKSSFSKDKDIVNFGESIIFKIKVTDNNELNNVQISFKNETVSHLLYSLNMQYNVNSGYYEYELFIDETVPNGTWYIDYIYATDKIGNYSLEHFDNEHSFTVNNQNSDSEPPYIDTSSIKIDNQNPVTNDIVNIQIKIVDNISVDRATIDLINLNTGQSKYSENLSYNPNTKMYEYSFKIDDSVSIGHWRFHIYATDSIGNYALKYFNGTEYILVVTDKGEDIHAWDDGVITKNPTTTEEGIKTYTCKLWVCGMTKTESIPILSDNNDNNNNKPEDPSGKPSVSPTPDFDNTNNDNSGSNNEENRDDNISSTPSWWTPATEEEKIRYECMGKEKIQYITLNNQPFNINIQNAMQGEKCFDVFKNVADDYTIARTYNIFPLIETQKYATDEKVTISLTIPETLRSESREFKMICVSQYGVPFIFEDQDKDADTITISTDKFYAYALIYKDLK